MKLNSRIISTTCAALLCLALAACGSGTVETPTQAETQPATVTTTLEVVETAEEETTSESETETNKAEETLAFELVAGERGDYGKEKIYNEGTECEDKRIAYYVPYGTYKITNVGDYMTQVNVYSDETVITDAGWEEVADVGSVKLIDVDASEEMTVPKGYHIEITEPTHLLLEMISEN